MHRYALHRVRDAAYFFRLKNVSNALRASGDLSRSLNWSASSSMRRTISSGAPFISRREIATPSGGSAAIARAALIASDGPGFGVDEPMDRLGEKLVLPPFLEGKRAQIEAGLKPL